MQQRTLDYDSGIRASDEPSTARTIQAAAVSIGALAIMNTALVVAADKSWGAFYWMFIYIPVANLIFAAVSLALIPVVRRLAGVSILSHVLISTMCPVAAAVIDGVVMFPMLHGC
jgi:hypothetical protein